MPYCTRLVVYGGQEAKTAAAVCLCGAVFMARLALCWQEHQVLMVGVMSWILPCKVGDKWGFVLVLRPFLREFNAHGMCEGALVGDGAAHVWCSLCVV